MQNLLRPAKYATAFLAVLNVESGRLQYTNAGHNPGLWLRSDGSSEWLRSTDCPIGVLPDASFSSAEIVLGPGDLFMVYTDGLTEAADPAEEVRGRAASRVGTTPSGQGVAGARPWRRG